MAKKRKEPKGSVSRRSFLTGVGVGTGALTAGLLSPVEFAEAEQASSAASGSFIGPGPVPITLRINGQTHRLNLEPRVTLLDALRNHLDLTGAKKVCDRGECGACTVEIDANPTYSCTVLAIEAQGRNITTIEGLSHGEHLHPLMTAFVDHDAQQCGFCTPGFVMASKCLLDKNSNPSAKDVRHGLSGNFCRCGTYKGLREALADESVRGGKSRTVAANRRGGDVNGGM